MTVPLCGVRVDPNGTTHSVTITDDEGATPTVYSDAYAQNTVALPKSITSPFTFYLPNPGTWTVAGTTITLEGSQVGSVTFAAQSGAYVPLPSGGTAGQVPVITTAGSPPTMGWETPGGTPSYKTTVGDGTTKTFTITHNLNDLDVMVTVWDLTLGQITYPTVGGHSNVNSVTVTFSVAPTANQMRVIVGAF